MSEKGDLIRIECRTLPDNQVELSTVRVDEPTTVVALPAAEVVAVVSALLSAVSEAGREAGVQMHPMPGEPLQEMPEAKPTGIGLMQGKTPNSAAIVFQFGSARLAIRMGDRELGALGQALSAFGTGEQRPN